MGYRRTVPSRVASPRLGATGLAVLLAVLPVRVASGHPERNTAAPSALPRPATDPAADADRPGGADPATDDVPAARGGSAAPPAPRPDTHRSPAQDEASPGGTAPNAEKPAGYVLAPGRKGTFLLVTAALAGGAALAEHAIAVGTIRSTCGLAEDGIEQFQELDPQDPQAQPREVVEVTAFSVLCTVSIGPALTLRTIVPLLLGGSLAMAAGGGYLRGEALAFRDTFVAPRRRP